MQIASPGSRRPTRTSLEKIIDARWNHIALPQKWTASVDPIDTVVYSSPKLGFFPNVCCRCAMEVGPENGPGGFEI